jgi:hypothetical protein
MSSPGWLEIFADREKAIESVRDARSAERGASTKR